MEFKSIDEYYKEFINTGMESFYDFLEEKLQEAQGDGNQELANYIESLQNDVANQEFNKTEALNEKKKSRENWVDTNEQHTNGTAFNLEEKSKEELLEELKKLEIQKKQLLDETTERDRTDFDNSAFSNAVYKKGLLDRKIELLRDKICELEAKELETRLSSMSPEEIKAEYDKLNEQRESFQQMEDNGHYIYIDMLDLKINNALIEVIENYIIDNPELENIISGTNEKEALLQELSNVSFYLYELKEKMSVEDFQEQYESFEITDMWRERHDYEDRIKELESQIYMIEIGELGTRLPSMSPEEIKQEYSKLLQTRKSYTEMVEDGHEIDDFDWKINHGLIEMIEEYIRVNPELEEFVEPSNDEIEALLAKEMKSKSARDAGFEVNEFGEIIRPSKPLGEISTEDLSKLEEEMDKEIDANSEKIKQAQIDRLLAKQKIIREQRKTLKELEGQAMDFDD